MNVSVKSKYILVLSLLISSFLTSACAPVVLGGAAAGGVAVAQERSVGSAVDDVTIVTRVNSKFAQRNIPHLFSNIDVDSNEGRVLLTGSVERQETAIDAVKLAWEVPGVKEVINELQVTDRSGVADYSKDTYITGRVKGALLLQKGIRSINYNIETVNGAVYLIGIAQNQEELDKVVNIASRTPYVKKVINHVRLKQDPRRQ